MRWSKPDVRDQMIALLREELEARKLENGDLRRQLLAVMAPGAYRRLHEPGTQVVDIPTPGASGSPSPGHLPPYRLQDEKMWEQVARRFESAGEQ